MDSLDAAGILLSLNNPLLASQKLSKYFIGEAVEGEVSKAYRIYAEELLKPIVEDLANLEAARDKLKAPLGEINAFKGRVDNYKLKLAEFRKKCCVALDHKPKDKLPPWDPRSGLKPLPPPINIETPF